MPDHKRLWLLTLCAAGFLLLFWAQTIYVPYWQDDYLFLLDAHQASLEGRPWYAPFFPQTKVGFWRPLGMETYWRFIDTILHGNVVAAHAVNIILITLAAAAVGWFVATLVGRLAPEKDKKQAAVLAAFLYGIHSSHFLPAAWVSGANDSICVIFSALTLNFWLLVTSPTRHKSRGAALLVILCLLLALLSRDIAFVLPPLGLLLVLWLWPRNKPPVAAWCVGMLCLGVALFWLVARSHFTAAVAPEYAMRFGSNVARNAGCLLLFFFNTPFEALRYFFFVNASIGTAIWGFSCFFLQVAAFGILLRSAWAQLHIKGAVILGLFFIIGCAPYFLLSFNCYPYYTSIALIGYAAVAGLATLRKRALIAVLLLAISSSALATIGNFFFDSRSHIGRARWAEKQLVKLTALQKTDSRLFSTPLSIVVEDSHMFEGFRREGLAYRLGIDKQSIVLLKPNDPEAGKRTVLIVPEKGDVYFRERTTAK